MENNLDPVLDQDEEHEEPTLPVAEAANLEPVLAEDNVEVGLEPDLAEDNDGDEAEDDGNEGQIADEEVAQIPEAPAQAPIRRRRFRRRFRLRRPLAVPIPPNNYKTGKRPLNPYLPPRPKKAETPFACFVKEYANDFNLTRGQRQDQPPNTRRLLSVAGIEWKKLSMERKERYNNMAVTGGQDRKRAYQLWLKMRDMLQRPPNAYCIFTKEAWTNKDPGDQSRITDFSRRQSETWKNMDAQAKAPYFQRAAELLARHQEMYRTLRLGGNILPFLEDVNQEAPATDGNVENENVEMDDMDGDQEE